MTMTPEKAFYSRHAETIVRSSTPGDQRRREDEAAETFRPGGRYGAVSFAIERYGPIANALEIGCGPGITTRVLAERVQRAVGCDVVIDPEIATGEDDRVAFVEANANERFPFPDGEFDLVVAMMVMEHVFDPFHFCDEVARVLGPEGTFVLNVPLITALRHRWSILTGRLPVTSNKDWFASREWDGGHLHYFSLASLAALLRSSGFVLEHAFGVGRGHRLKTLWPSLLASEISLVARRTSDRRGTTGG